MVSGFLSGAAGGASVAIVIKAIDQYSKEFKKAETGMQKFGKVAKVVGIAAAGAFTAFTVSAVKAGLEMKPIEDSFRKLAKESDKFLFELDLATKGTISNFNLMSNANKALLLGLDQEALPDLFKNAAIVGRAAGRTTAEAIEDITLGIGRQSRMILDNLGIIIKAEDAYAVFAESIGKSTEELTAQEKQMAFNQSAMLALQESADKLGGLIPEDALTNLQQLTAGFQNFRVEFGKAFVDTFQVALPKSNKEWAEFGKTAGLILGIVTSSVVLTIRTIELAVRTVVNVIKVLLGGLLKSWEVSINFIIAGINKVLRFLGKGGIKPINLGANALFASAVEGTKAQAELFLNLANMAEQIQSFTGNLISGKTTAVGDAIIRPNGDVIKTHPNDTLIATKNGFGGGVTIIVEGSLIGLDEEDISRSLSDQLNNQTSL